MPRSNKKKIHQTELRILLALCAFILITAVSFFAAHNLQEFEAAKTFIASYGYISVLALAIFAGLNVFVPLPAATFVPIFTQAGLVLPFIVVTLVIGTTIADLIGYWIGKVSREYIKETRPRAVVWLTNLHDKHVHWTLPVVAAYAAIIPLPNELILIPLALMGSSWRLLIIALLIGNVIHQSALAYGYENIFRILF